MASLRTGNVKNAWIFFAFSIVFFIPLLVTVFHMIAARSPKLANLHEKHISLGQKHKTTFIPRWCVISGVIVIGLIILYTIIKWLFIYFQR
jgi:hypothetical protein